VAERKGDCDVSTNAITDKDMWRLEYVIGQDATHYIPLCDSEKHSLDDCQCHPVFVSPESGCDGFIHKPFDDRPRLSESFHGQFKGAWLVFASYGYTE